MDPYLVKRFQEYVMNAFPSKFYFFLNGWILRLTGGITYRANSVFPINYIGDETQVEKDIDIVEQAYEKFGLPSIFTMHDYFEPTNLDEILKNRGYKEDSHTNALIVDINRIKRKEVNQNYDYEIFNHRTEEFSNLLAQFTKKDQEQQEIINKISNRIIISKKRCIIAKYNGKVVGTLMGVQNPEGYVYISDILVLPDHRRNSVASSMIFTLLDEWAINENAKYIWLQVEMENRDVHKFYEALGMRKAYYYYYLKFQ